LFTSTIPSSEAVEEDGSRASRKWVYAPVVAATTKESEMEIFMR